jgi:hypothetical protein
MPALPDHNHSQPDRESPGFKKQLAEHSSPRGSLSQAPSTSGPAPANFIAAARKDLQNTPADFLFQPVKQLPVPVYNGTISRPQPAGETEHHLQHQIIRNIDVMLEPGDGLLPPADRRRPERSLFVLVTPEIFRQRPHTRLYGWLMNEYRQSPAALARDLPHREALSWPKVARRMGWLTWEDCEAVRPGSCRWLTDWSRSKQQMLKIT